MDKLFQRLMILMAIVFTVCGAGGSVYVFGATIASGECGPSGHESDVTWELTSPDGGVTCLLEISGSGEMKDYQYYNFPWYSYKGNITSLKINNGVTSIGANAFYGCSSLTQATLPDTITSINGSAFQGCSSLPLTSLPPNVTSIGGSAFYGCSRLTLTSLPNNLTSIGYHAFYNCSRLALTSLPDGITSIGNYTFYGCSDLVSISLPDNVTSIGAYAFMNCSNLESISMPDGITSIGGSAFCNCSKLELNSLPDNLTSLELGAFANCSSLTLTSLPNGITVIENGTFQDCTKLALTSLPYGITEIKYYGFKGCTSLALTSLPDRLTIIGSNAFSHCTKLALTSLPISITRIDQLAFYGCNSLTAVYYDDTKAHFESSVNLWDYGNDSLKDVLYFSDSDTVRYSASGFSGEYDGADHSITVNVINPASGGRVKYGTTAGIYDLTTSPKFRNAGTYTVYFLATAPGYRPVTGSAIVEIVGGSIQPQPQPHTHTHTLIHHDRVEATDYADGNIEYWECSICGEYFSDANGQHVINASNVIIPKKISLFGNKPMDYRTEDWGGFTISYNHSVPFWGKSKPDVSFFGDITVSVNGVEVEVTKIKVNKKKRTFQITGINSSDKALLKALKRATKGNKGLPFMINPYYVTDNDDVLVKMNNKGVIKSVKIMINGKYYKAKKGEWSNSGDTIVFDSQNLTGSWKI